ncbi:MAG: histidinol dehydrogenase [Nocardioidaceae bacterium]|nr:histidinol dehydrogenase [Nocardioidaceae bacterium]
MLRRLDLRGSTRGADPAVSELPRADYDVAAAAEAVRAICDDVRERGAAAVREASVRFDGVDPGELRVPADQIAAALRALDADVRVALEEAIRRLRRTCAAQRGADVVTEVVPGGSVRQRLVPVRRVGLYVPGGRAPLVSSVLMGAVPVEVAGCASVALASPPLREFGGRPHPTVLAACALLGVDEVYAVGGAQAIAMFAYGAGDCRPVDLVAGPGNVYVVAAKRLLRGRVGIDSEAGPTEIAVLADDAAEASFVAADLVSQAEHGVESAAVLVTDSVTLADAVDAELARQVPAAKHAERIERALTGAQSCTVLVDDLDHGQALLDAYAAEHVSLQTRDAAERSLRLHHAGAIFVGGWSPVSLGDYCAGSNHVLPTGGSARHAAGLSVRTFLRSVQVVTYDRAALAAAAAHVVALADAEDLPAHGAALRTRTGQ